MDGLTRPPPPSRRISARYLILQYTLVNGQDLDAQELRRLVNKEQAHCTLSRYSTDAGALQYLAFVDFQGKRFQTRNQSLFDIEGHHPQWHHVTSSPARAYDFCVQEREIIFNDATRPSVASRKTTVSLVEQCNTIVPSSQSSPASRHPFHPSRPRTDPSWEGPSINATRPNIAICDQLEAERKSWQDGFKTGFQTGFDARSKLLDEPAAQTSWTHWDMRTQGGKGQTAHASPKYEGRECDDPVGVLPPWHDDAELWERVDGTDEGPWLDEELKRILDSCVESL